MLFLNRLKKQNPTINIITIGIIFGLHDNDTISKAPAVNPIMKFLLIFWLLLVNNSDNAAKRLDSPIVQVQYKVPMSGLGDKTSTKYLETLNR